MRGYFVVIYGELGLAIKLYIPLAPVSISYPSLLGDPSTFIFLSFIFSKTLKIQFSMVGLARHVRSSRRALDLIVNPRLG